MCIRKARARLKAGTWVCYVRLQPTCCAIQLLCSSLLISQQLCGFNNRLSKSLCESSSPREMNLFVQKRTVLNQVIHFSDIVGRNKYTFHNLPLSCFFGQTLQEEQLNFIERHIQAVQFCQEGRKKNCIDTVDGRQSWSSLCKYLLTCGPFRAEHQISHCSNADISFKVFLPWQLFSL